MKIKLSDIIGNEKSIQALQQLSISAKVSYRIKRLFNELTPIYKSFNEQSVKIAEKYGEKNTKGGYDIKPESRELFDKEINDLLQLEEEIKFVPIKIAELGDLKIAAKDIVDFIFTE